MKKYCEACTLSPFIDLATPGYLCDNCLNLFKEWYRSDPAKRARFIRERWLDAWLEEKKLESFRNHSLKKE